MVGLKNKCSESVKTGDLRDMHDVQPWQLSAEGQEIQFLHYGRVDLLFQVFITTSASLNIEVRNIDIDIIWKKNSKLIV